MAPQLNALAHVSGFAFVEGAADDADTTNSRQAPRPRRVVIEVIVVRPR